jgi:hypothetical protein
LIFQRFQTRLLSLVGCALRLVVAEAAISLPRRRRDHIATAAERAFVQNKLPLARALLRNLLLYLVSETERFP